MNYDFGCGHDKNGELPPRSGKRLAGVTGWFNMLKRVCANINMGGGFLPLFAVSREKSLPGARSFTTPAAIPVSLETPAAAPALPRGLPVLSSCLLFSFFIPFFSFCGTQNNEKNRIKQLIFPRFE